jgi:hypothetical protein
MQIRTIPTMRIGGDFFKIDYLMTLARISQRKF